jgi:hypothetical protein
VTAHVTITHYGDRTHVVCTACGLDQPYDRWHQATEAARWHDAQHHPQEAQ